MTTEMNLAEAENLVAKLLPEWEEMASSNFAGFAEMLLNDYEDWARDTLECVLMPSEDEFVRTFEAWKLVADRYFKAMCRPVPSFKTADGVTCYVGDLVYCKDGKRHEVTEVCLNGEIVYVSDVGASAPTEVAMVTFYEPEAPKSLKAVRAEKQAEREQAERKAAAESRIAACRDLLAALNDRGSFYDRLLFELTQGAGYVGIKCPMSESAWTMFVDTDKGSETLEWWASRDVRFMRDRLEDKGVVLYVDGVQPSLIGGTWLDFKKWGKYQHLKR